MLQKAHGFVDLLTEKNIYIDELAEQKRSKLEQNIQYMHFEKEAKQVSYNSTQIYPILICVSSASRFPDNVVQSSQVLMEFFRFVTTSRFGDFRFSTGKTNL